MGQLDAAHQAMMTPANFSVAGPGPAPAIPKPADLPTTDFSQSDADLKAMQPIAMTEKEKIQKERRGFFQGISEALMKSNGNEGLGTFLMHLGGAALGGRLGAQDQIEKDMDKFDEKMAQYRAAVFSNDMNKAKVHQNEAQAQVEQSNQYAMRNWSVAYDAWKGAGGHVDISGTSAVVSRKDANGNMSVSVLPIPGAVDAMIAREKAQLFESVGGRQMGGNQQITGMENALLGQQAARVMSQSGGGDKAIADAAATAAPAAYATFLTTHGGVADALGPDGAKSLEESVSKQLMAQQIMPGSKEWIDAHDRVVATELTKLAIASPQMMKRMMQAGGAMSSFQALDAVNSARESSRTDAKGRTTTSSTMRASDIFSSDAFNQQLADHGYTRQ
jgi:hypothetical protein